MTKNKFITVPSKKLKIGDKITLDGVLGIITVDYIYREYNGFQTIMTSDGIQREVLSTKDILKIDPIEGK